MAGKSKKKHKTLKAARPRPIKTKFEYDLARAFRCYQQTDMEASAAICLEVLKSEPNNIDAKMLLGMIACFQKKWLQAAEFLSSVVPYKTKVAGVRFSYGRALDHLKQRQGAIREYRASLILSPGDTEAMLCLGNVYAAEQMYEEALQMYERLYDINNDSVEALTNIGRVLSVLGYKKQSMETYAKANTINPENYNCASGLLAGLNYVPDLDSQHTFFRIKEVVAAMFPGRILDSNKDLYASEKTIRVGIVSADFCVHSVSFFLRPFLESYNRGKITLVAYYNGTVYDEVTEFVASKVSKIEGISELHDEAVLAQIKTDDIDVLIDLSGYLKGGRLGVFALRSAPVQLAWLGYPNTTGLESMDFRLVDEITDPEGLTDPFYTESLFRLPRGFLCFTDDVSANVAENIPLQKNGHLTFGCFNNSEKITGSVIAAWARILHRVKNARLLLKSIHFSSQKARKEIIGRFKELGIEKSRIKLLGFIEKNHLELYNDVDLALDTFPYNGTTTTCQSLWMGVPTVAFTGDLHASRVSASILHRVGLDDFVSDDVEGYIETAVKMAGQVDYLSELKVTLRDRMLKSDLCDGEGFARQMEEAFEWMLEQKRAKQA
jgi:predicted O-linked N-acetylglucosamine transferase (SPINDLY family)